MKPLLMKLKAILLILILSCGHLSAKNIHFFSNDLFGIAGFVKIYNGNEKLLEITKNQSLVLKVDENVSSVSLTFKWGLRLNKKLDIDLTNKETIFIYVYLNSVVWSVYESTDPNIPKSITELFEPQQSIVELAIRIKNHPLTSYTKASLLNYLEKPKSANEGFYKAAIMTSYASEAEIGVVKTDEGYTIVYLSGGNKAVWKEGDLKGIFTKTANDNIFRAKWYFENKKSIEGLYFTFENATMKIIGENGNPDQIFIKHYPMNVSLAANKVSISTGFALSGDGLITTSYDVVNGSTNIYVKGVNGDFTTAYKAKVAVSDKNNGIAILKIEDSNFKGTSQIPYIIKQMSSDIGENVFTLNYPSNATLLDEIRLTNGMISSKTGFQGDITSYEISAPVQSGNSGGPVFDKSGNLIGILQSKQGDAGNVSYAVKISYLKNMIDVLPVPPKFSETNPLANLSLSEQIKLLNKFVYVIEAK